MPGAGLADRQAGAAAPWVRERRMSLLPRAITHGRTRVGGSVRAGTSGLAASFGCSMRPVVEGAPRREPARDKTQRRALLYSRKGVGLIRDRDNAHDL